MATLTPQTITVTGMNPVYSAAAAGSKIQCSDRMFLHVKNAAGSSMTVTLAATATSHGQKAADVVVTVPATTGDAMIGPIFADLYAGLSDGLATITYSSTTSVTVAAIRL